MKIASSLLAATLVALSLTPLAKAQNSTPPRGSTVSAKNVSVPDDEVPAILAGAVTKAEFKTFSEFEKNLRHDPEVEQLNRLVLAKVKELQDAQAQLDAARKRVVSRTPELDAIIKKIQAALEKNVLVQQKAAPVAPTAPPTAKP